MRSIWWGLIGAVVCGSVIVVAQLSGASGPENHLIDNPFGAAFSGYVFGWFVSEANYWFDRRNKVH